MITTLLLVALGETVTVTLPMEAQVTGTEITLGEIATVAGPDAERVEAVRLGYAPQPGYSRLFHAARLEQLVERSTGVDVELRGDRACRVWPVTREVPLAELRAEAARELGRLAADHEVEYAPRAEGRSIEVPAGVRGYELRARLDDDALRSGPLSVPVEILVDGAPYRTVWTTFDVSIYESRTVLNRRVGVGERLDPASFSVKRVRVPKLDAGRTLARRQRVVGAIAARDLPENSLVTELDVTRPIAIRRGSSVFLEARKGTVSARVPAVARQDGRLGDRIVVETMTSGRQLSAVVLSKDLVQIDLGAIGGK